VLDAIKEHHHALAALDQYLHDTSTQVRRHQQHLRNNMLQQQYRVSTTAP
jgi:hypothetical protein